MPIKKKTCFIRFIKPKLNYMLYIIDTSNDSESLKIKMGEMHMKKMKTGKKNRHHNLTIRKDEFREKTLVLELWST